MITVRIDVNKIDKTRFFQGEKGKYLNLILIETPKSEFGDYMVKQEQTKEERDQKVRTPIIGNAKILERKGGNVGGARKGGDDAEDW